MTSVTGSGGVGVHPQVSGEHGEVFELAARLLDELATRGLTLAVAESLTGGAVCSGLTDVPGASRVLRGGVVAYATDVKSGVLRVDADLLERTGPVTAAVAEEMAQGVRVVLGASLGIATTGEAGPESASGATPGTVFVAVAAESGAWVDELALVGDRAGVRRGAVLGVLQLLGDVIDEL